MQDVARGVKRIDAFLHGVLAASTGIAGACAQQSIGDGAVIVIDNRDRYGCGVVDGSVRGKVHARCIQVYVLPADVLGQ